MTTCWGCKKPFEHKESYKYCTNCNLYVRVKEEESEETLEDLEKRVAEFKQTALIEALDLSMQAAKEALGRMPRDMKFAKTDTANAFLQHLLLRGFNEIDAVAMTNEFFNVKMPVLKSTGLRFSDLK